MQSIGENVYRLRTKLALSTRDVAKAAGMSCAQVTAIETGRTQDPRISTVIGLARALDVSVGELIDEI